MSAVTVIVISTAVSDGALLLDGTAGLFSAMFWRVFFFTSCPISFVGCFIVKDAKYYGIYLVLHSYCCRENTLHTSIEKGK